MKRFLVMLVVLLVVSCATSVKRETVEETGNVEVIKKSRELMKILEVINSNSPGKIKSSFTVSGSSRVKKYRFDGRMYYDNNELANIILMDYIFKSPLIKFYRNGKKLYFYYPSEKKLFVDDFEKIDLDRYAGVKADFDFLYKLFTGNVPLLSNATVKNCVKTKSGSDVLILENDDFYESIFFRKNTPDKILVLHKLSKKKVEIYLDSMMKKGKTRFVRKLRIVAPDKRLKLKVSFSGTKLNGVLKVNKFNPDSIKKGVQIIKIN